MRPPVRRGRSERGAGLLGAALGVAMVMALVGLAANVVLGLWSRSTVDAVAQDAARRLAADPEEDRPRLAPVALDQAHRLLGRFADRVELTVEALAPDVVLRVRSRGVALLPRLLPAGSVGATDHLVVARGERSAP